MRFESVIFALSSLAGAACAGDSARCITVASDCAPLYQPTFQNVFSRTLAPTCAVAGPCHSADNAAGGLAYGSADQAYELLLGSRGGSPRVVPGDPGCSEIVRRIESTNSRYRMPPGDTALNAQERCSIIQWIARGAER